MKVTRIVIEIALETAEESGHATRIEYLHGRWSSNGTIYARVQKAMTESLSLLAGTRPHKKAGER